MTITAISDLICDKLGRTDTDSKTICKSFIKRRYEMLFDSNLWLEALATSSKAVVAGTSDYSLDGAPEVFYYPNASVTAANFDIDRILAVRFVKTGEDDGEMLHPSDWWTFFKVNPNSLTNDANHQARPRNFIPIPADSDGNARIRLVPAPDEAGTLYVLGKLKWNEPADSDAPVIHGIDNALLAYAEGDMLEHHRQYGKAQVKYQEGAAQLALMREQQENQTASDPVIVPHVFDGVHRDELLLT